MDTMSFDLRMGDDNKKMSKDYRILSTRIRNNEKQCLYIYGVIMMHLASWYGDNVLVKYLIRKGVDVNATTTKYNVEWETSLHLAAANGMTKTLKLLIKAGAQINVCDSLIRTPLLRAAVNHHLRAWRYLISKGAKYNPERLPFSTMLLDSAILAKTQCTPKRYILDELKAGFDVNHPTDCEGHTLLHCTISRKYGDFGTLCDIPALLIKHGANINAKTSMGGTVLRCAIDNNDVWAVQQLIAAGVDVGAYMVTNDIMVHPLAYVINKNNREIAIMLKAIGSPSPYRCCKLLSVNAEYEGVVGISALDTMDPFFDDMRRRLYHARMNTLQIDQIATTLIMAGYDTVGSKSPLNIIHVSHIIPIVMDLITADAWTYKL